MEKISFQDTRSVIGKYMLADGMSPVIDLDKSHGSWLVDGNTGKEYLDLFSMFASMSIGYNHPYVLEQKERLTRAAINKPTNSDVYSPLMAEFVDTMGRVAQPDYLPHSFYVSGGALAVENALKAAFDWKVRLNIAKGNGEKGNQVLHFKQCFHGRSGYTLSLTDSPDPRKVQYFPKFNWPRVTPPSMTFPLNENNLVCRATIEIKKKYKNQIGIMCDVALDPYTSHGHDGLIKSNQIINDETIEVLINQSLLQAEMGCDVLAPSDMMDGRIGKIRKALDKSNFQNVQILSYAAKYASSFYGPFRDAVGSKGSLKGDKKTYQMDFRNSDEAIREVALDIKEGADMVMVKPGMPYLDIIKSIKEKFKIPVFAYQVSGEYSLISNAIQKKIINKDAVYESLVAFKRAGANAIVSYYADRIDKIIK